MDGAMAGHLYFAIVRVPARPPKQAQKVTAARVHPRIDEERRDKIAGTNLKVQITRIPGDHPLYGRK